MNFLKMNFSLKEKVSYQTDFINAFSHKTQALTFLLISVFKKKHKKNYDYVQKN